MPDSLPDSMRSATPYEVDWETPLEELVESLGLPFDDANALIQLPEEVVRMQAAKRAADLDRDRNDATPPVPMKGGRLGIRFRHLALDSLEDDAYQELLDGLVGREGHDPKEAKSAFPAGVRALDGKDVALVGYMIPEEWNDAEVLEFMLVRDLLACCFGGSPQPDEWVKVRMRKGKGARYYPYVPVIVYGQVRIEGMADAVGYPVGCFAMEAVRVEREE